jgi:hypothetical protein
VYVLCLDRFVWEKWILPQLPFLIESGPESEMDSMRIFPAHQCGFCPIIGFGDSQWMFHVKLLSEQSRPRRGTDFEDSIGDSDSTWWECPLSYHCESRFTTSLFASATASCDRLHYLRLRRQISWLRLVTCCPAQTCPRKEE